MPPSCSDFTNSVPSDSRTSAPTAAFCRTAGWASRLALAFVIFGFIGTEVVAVTAGEAKDPERSVPRAMRTMLLRLVIFYVGAITILVGVIPWTEVEPGQSITVGPFVRVFDLDARLPPPRAIINFVVLTAAPLRHELLPLSVYAV